MKIGVPNRSTLAASGEAGHASLQSLEGLISALSGWQNMEHTEDGAHGVVTAQSIAINAVRNAALTVVSGHTSLGGGVAGKGTITPAILTADTHNYGPSGIDGVFCVRVSTDATRLLTGLQDGPRRVPLDGRILMLFNAGSNNITLVHESVASTAEYRFRLPGFANLPVTPNNSVILYYDAKSRRWTVLSSSNGAGGSVFAEYNAGNSGASITLDWANGTQQILTLTNNAVISFTNPSAGGKYYVVLVQDGTGGRVPTYAANVTIVNTVIPAARTGAGALLLLTLVYTVTGGGRYLASYQDLENITEDEFAFTDVVTANSSTAAHGLLKKLSNAATEFMNGQGNWATPAGGTGDVVGPAASVEKEIALFDGATGKLLERATGTGIVRVVSGVYGTPGNVVESEITLADNVTNNALTTAHGFLKKLSNVATEFMNGQGNWAVPAGGGSSVVVQVKNVQTGAVATGTTVIPFDDTIPQNTEGDEFMTLAITPTNSTNILKIDVVVFATPNASNWVTAALFQDSTANALAAIPSYENIATANGPIMFSHYMVAGTTSATTFKVRVGRDASAGTTVTFNGQSAGRIFGGVMASSITITEVTP